MTKFYTYDPEGNGYQEFNTKEEALKDADEAIQDYLDDGWSEEVNNVVSGTVTHRATQVDLKHKPPKEDLDENGETEEGDSWSHDFDTMCDYKMKTLKLVNTEIKNPKNLKDSQLLAMKYIHGRYPITHVALYDLVLLSEYGLITGTSVVFKDVGVYLTDKGLKYFQDYHEEQE